MTEVHEVLNVWADAERDGDIDAIGELLTDDFVAVGPLGFVLTKSEWLDRQRSKDLQYEAFDLDQISIRAHGDISLVTAHHTANGTYRGHPIPDATRLSLTLFNSDGRWRIAGAHTSIIAGTPGAPLTPTAIRRDGEHATTARLDHTIVPATNKRASAEFLAMILGTSTDPEWGPFVPVSIDNDMTLDFVDATDVHQHHYAFLVSDDDFDAMLVRIKESSAGFYADPGRSRGCEINHHDGGRGVYFDDPDRHLMELITRPYGTGPR